jgi:hypothetical protein
MHTINEMVERILYLQEIEKGKSREEATVAVVAIVDNMLGEDN